MTARHQHSPGLVKDVSVLCDKWAALVVVLDLSMRARLLEHSLDCTIT